MIDVRTAIVIGLLMLVVVMLIAVGAWYLIGVALNERRGYYETLTNQLKGRYLRRRRPFEPHRVEFQLEGRAAVVEFVRLSADDLGRTRILVPMHGRSPGTMHILPDGFGRSFLTMFGAQDLSIGDRAFDGKYVVKATPESLATRVFSPERRRQVIQTVQRLSVFADPTFQLTRDHLRVQVREEIDYESRLMTLVTAAREFLGYLVGVAPVEMVFEEVRTAQEATCQVCGTALDREVVRCEDCKTPHHLECWRYVGECSTYACKGKRGVA